jgi:hypothetical protein
MTITFGLWIVPAIITLGGGILVGSRRPRDYDFTGAFFMFTWLVASLVAWIMWGLTWL